MRPVKEIDSCSNVAVVVQAGDHILRYLWCKESRDEGRVADMNSKGFKTQNTSYWNDAVQDDGRQ